MWNDSLGFVSTTLVLWVLLNSSTVNLVMADTAAEDLTLTYQEKVTLDKFKGRVFPILPQAYMKQDIYLIRFLREQNLNLHDAEELLKDNLRWRRDNRMETILKENFSDMEAEYAYTNDNFDKAGRPVATTTLGHWDIRKAALAGKLPRVQRYLYKILEETTHRVMKEQLKGNNVTRYKLLINLDGFNQIQQGCPLCLPLWANFASTMQNRYPKLADQVIFINMPPIFSLVLDVINPVISQSSQKVIIKFDQNKRTWMKYLDKEISRDQRRQEFGGNLSN